MRYIFAIALLIASLPALASDGYVGWSELSFRSGPWSIHLALSGDSSRISALSIAADGVVVEVPAAAAAPLGQPFLNEVKLLSVCCSDHVVLQIPVLQFDDSGHSTKRIWEIHVAGGKFQSAAYRQSSTLNSADES
ncbi:hypothetical protein [Luteimonas cucumeris]|uniref:hypothetical protein n=1 Tax=Luteimonas cucumeris TaxID=985012 RepID=UPI0011A42DD9|nr:hypothetical protein [Luteimonas cucumeris]